MPLTSKASRTPSFVPAFSQLPEFLGKKHVCPLSGLQDSLQLILMGFSPDLGLSGPLQDQVGRRITPMSEVKDR